MFNRTVVKSFTVRNSKGEFIARYEVIHKTPGEHGFEVLVTLPHCARFSKDSGGTREEATTWAAARANGLVSFDGGAVATNLAGGNDQNCELVMLKSCSCAPILCSSDTGAGTWATRSQRQTAQGTTLRSRACHLCGSAAMTRLSAGRATCGTTRPAPCWFAGRISWSPPRRPLPWPHEPIPATLRRSHGAGRR